MIGLPQSVPIYLCTTPVDFRKGFDGLTGIVITEMNHQVTDPSVPVRFFLALGESEILRT